MATTKKVLIANERLERVRAAICEVFDGTNMMGESTCAFTKHKQCIRAAKAVLRVLSGSAA